MADSVQSLRPLKIVVACLCVIQLCTMFLILSLSGDTAPDPGITSSIGVGAHYGPQIELSVSEDGDPFLILRDSEKRVRFMLSKSAATFYSEDSVETLVLHAGANRLDDSTRIVVTSPLKGDKGSPRVVLAARTSGDAFLSFINESQGLGHFTCDSTGRSEVLLGNEARGGYVRVRQDAGSVGSAAIVDLDGRVRWSRP